jgi:hypothetical protein
MIRNSVYIKRRNNSQTSRPLFTESPLDCPNKIFPLHVSTNFFKSYVNEIPEYLACFTGKPSSAYALNYGRPFFGKGPHPLLWARSRAARGKIRVNSLAECWCHQSKVSRNYWSRNACFMLNLLWCCVLRTFREKAPLSSSWSNWLGQWYYQVS